ncbi:MAG: hypothetical protein L3J91_07015 [Thermoplasmata archaeon]|nr:hypothetical protein [Thermoplasmata archaeon]
MIGRGLPTARLGLAALALVLLAAVPIAVPFAHASSGSTTLPLTGSIHGPANVGAGLKGSFSVNAAGGPAQALNDTQVGTYAYTASISAVNTTGASITPVSGVLVNFTIALTLNAPNVTEPLTIYVLVNSSYNGQSTAQNFSYSVQIIEPYRLAATLVVGPNAAVAGFDLTVLLDNQPVGAIVVHGLSAGQSYPISFAYVPNGLAPGWHTFLLSLSQEHGLVSFAGGEQVLSVSFYVAGGGTDYTEWYLAGIAVFVGVIFIWSTSVGGRRRARPKT